MISVIWYVVCRSRCLVPRACPKSKVDLFYGIDCFVIAHIYIVKLIAQM